MKNVKWCAVITHFATSYVFPIKIIQNKISNTAHKKSDQNKDKYKKQEHTKLCTETNNNRHGKQKR
jgi:hypothetical protein